MTQTKQKDKSGKSECGEIKKSEIENGDRLIWKNDRNIEKQKDKSGKSECDEIKRG